MSIDLKESVVYITGATAGIGYATAKLCLEKGAQVIITGRNKERLAQAKSELLKISSLLTCLKIVKSHFKAATTNAQHFHSNASASPVQYHVVEFTPDHGS